MSLQEGDRLKILQETQYKMIAKTVPYAVTDPEPELILINSVLQETVRGGRNQTFIFPLVGQSCQIVC